MATSSSHQPDLSLQPSPLLRLPLELRDMIWKLVAHKRRLSDQHYDPTTASYLLHPLRVTCRSINDEASPYIFNLTIFSIATHAVPMKRFHIWLQRIGADNRRAIHRFYPRIEELHSSGLDPHVEALKWAHVFKILPGLRHLRLSTPWDPANDCSRQIFYDHCRGGDFHPIDSGRLELLKVLQNHPSLSSWSSLKGPICMPAFSTAASTLKALQVNIEPHEDLEHLPDHFTDCPSLQFLQLGRFPQGVWREFESSEQHVCDPPVALTPRILYTLRKGIVDCTARHTSGVHITLTDSCWWYVELNVDWSPLISKCPKLSYLGLECGRTSSQIDSFPSSLQTLALIFYSTVDMDELARRLLALKARCHGLEVVAIYTNWHGSDGRNDDVLATSEPVLGVLKQFKEQGVHVAFFVRMIANRYGVDESTNEDTDEDAFDDAISDAMAEAMEYELDDWDEILSDDSTECINGSEVGQPPSHINGGANLGTIGGTIADESDDSSGRESDDASDDAYDGTNVNLGSDEDDYASDVASKDERELIRGPD